jgi:regulator of RNase E activity RraA
MNKNQDLKQALTKAVIATTSTAKGKKSKGTVIGTIVRDVPIITVAPFSL